MFAWIRQVSLVRKRYCHSLSNTVTKQPPRARPKNPSSRLIWICFNYVGAGPSRALYPRPIFTNKFHLSSLHSYQLVAVLDRKSRALGLLVIPLHQRHRVGGCEKGKSQSYSNCHLPNVITFQLRSATPSFLFWDRSTVSETPCDRIESTPLEGVSLLRVGMEHCGC